jgi:uncharacterized protein YcbK (DUF882 family)
MQGWTRNATTDATNEELRRVRKELTRAESGPLRIIVAGDPTKPVLTFTIPRRLPRTVGVATALCCAAAFLGGWHHASPPGAINESGARATAMVEARMFDEPRAEAAEIPAVQAPSRSTHAAVATQPRAAEPSPAPEPPVVEPAPKGKAPAEPSVAATKHAPEHFTVEISNTGKVFELTLSGPAGEPDEESYRTLRHELRCQRTGAENPIDPRLVEMLHQISVHAGSRIQVVSAFRAPLFPRDLNYHVRGMAADIRVPGLTTAELRDLARSLGATGVGYYPTVQFVHVDIRETPYFWTDTSGHNDNHQHDAATPVDTAGSPAEAAPAASAEAPSMPPSAPTPTFLLPSVSAPAAPPARTPAQNAADRLGLPVGAF